MKDRIWAWILLIGIFILAMALIGIFWPHKNPPQQETSRVGPAEVYPNAQLTPGVLNPEINQDNIKDNICAHGRWSTRMIRPPLQYTNTLKRLQIDQYGYADKDPKSYEEDHMISLTLGGHPTDPKNLWPEPWYTKPYNAGDKDVVEVYLWQKVCKGEMKLDEAQKAIVNDWVAIFEQTKKEGYESPYNRPKKKLEADEF